MVLKDFLHPNPTGERPNKPKTEVAPPSPPALVEVQKRGAAACVETLGAGDETLVPRSLSVVGGGAKRKEGFVKEEAGEKKDQKRIKKVVRMFQKPGQASCNQTMYKKQSGKNQLASPIPPRIISKPIKKSLKNPKTCFNKRKTYQEALHKW